MERKGFRTAEKPLARRYPLVGVVNHWHEFTTREASVAEAEGEGVLNHFGGSSGNRSFRRLCTASLRSRLGMLVLISEHLLSRARQRAVLSYVKRAEPPKRLSTQGEVVVVA